MQRNNLARHLTLLTTSCFKETWVKFVPHHLHHSHGAAASLKNLEHNDSLLWKLFLIVDLKGFYYIIYKLTLSGFYIRWCFSQIYFMMFVQLNMSSNMLFRFLIKKKKPAHSLCSSTHSTTTTCRFLTLDSRTAVMYDPETEHSCSFSTELNEQQLCYYVDVKEPYEF